MTDIKFGITEAALLEIGRAFDNSGVTEHLIRVSASISADDGETVYEMFSIEADEINEDDQVIFFDSLKVLVAPLEAKYFDNVKLGFEETSEGNKVFFFSHIKCKES